MRKILKVVAYVVVYVDQLVWDRIVLWAYDKIVEAGSVRPTE